jgi:hypothetical protein
MRVTDVPMPAGLRARPRDDRGYPVPAITPWDNGVPVFAATGTARTYICAVERRCSVCGSIMPAGPVWRVVGAAEAAAIEAVLAAGHEYRNQTPTVEAPGHRICMLYAAVVCPYLARPTARRGQAAVLPGYEAVRGDRQGLGGAVVGFANVEHAFNMSARSEGGEPRGANSELTGTVLFRFRELCSFTRHEAGEDQFAELQAALALEAADPAEDLPEIPGYLLTDEESATRRFLAHRRADPGSVAAPA